VHRRQPLSQRQGIDATPVGIGEWVDNHIKCLGEALANKIGYLVRQAGDVAARSRQAGDQAGADWVPSRREDDGDDRRRLLGGQTMAVPDVTITSTLRWTNSAAISAARSVRPSVQRYSTAIV